MKRSIFTLKSVIILLAALTFVGCSEDEKSPNNPSIELDGNSFAVSAATMLGLSMEDEGHTAITFIGTSGSQINTLTIDVESFTAETIEGEYAYPAVSNKKLIDEWLTNYTIIEDEETESSTNLESGEVTITHNSGNNYSITMNLVMVNGETFTGTYTGDFEVMFYNY